MLINQKSFNKLENKLLKDRYFILKKVFNNNEMQK